jgi:putative transposase
LIVFNEGSLKRHLQAYADYYHRSRTHLALDKDCPQTRAVQSLEVGSIVSIPEVGGLHHRYERGLPEAQHGCSKRFHGSLKLF